jgi:hypothetical protein
LNVMPKALAGTLATAAAVVAVGAMAMPSLAGTFSGTYGFGANSAAPTNNVTSSSIVPAGTVTFGAFSNGSGVPGANVPGVGNPERSYQAAGWGAYTGATKTSNAQQDTDYFQFSVAPTPTNNLTIKTISFDAINALGGPVAWNLRAFLGAPAANAAFGTGIDLGSGSITGSWVNNSVNITSVLLQNVSQQVTFRLYGSGATGVPLPFGLGQTSGILGTFGVDNVKVDGTAIPTPAAIPAIIAFGAGLWRKRKQQDEVVAD